MIRIGKPHVEVNEQEARLLTPLDIDGDTKEIFVSLELKYKDYLCADRGDAALIGMLRYAMLHGHDIVSEAPVNEDLYYKITEILLPTLKANDSSVHVCRIMCNRTKQKSGGGGVGTGLSCGVDSFYSVLKHHGTELPGHELTHLVVYNAGSFNGIYRNFGIEAVKDRVWERAAAAAEELGLPLIQVDSNIHRITGYNHLFSHTYLDMFMVYSLQNLWSRYYYGSGVDYNKFDLSNNLHGDPAHFELLLLNCFSTSSLEVVLSGAEVTRTDKVAYIASSSVVQKYLHVCTSEDENCGVCEKCRRTLLALDAAGHIDDFSQSFPVEHYKNNREDYYRFLCERHFLNDGQYRDSYEKTFMLLYPKHREEFDRYLRQCHPAVAYGKNRMLESWLEAMRKQFHLLEAVVDCTHLQHVLEEKLAGYHVKRVAFYEESAIRRFMTEVLAGTAIEIAYVVSDVPVMGENLTVFRKEQENLPSVDLLIITDFIAPTNVRRKLKRFKGIGQVMSAEELLLE